MAVLPFRGLAEKGILKDPSPYQLDLNAWTGGSGVRFHGNKAMRAPIFRAVVDPLPAAPAFVFGHRPTTGYDLVFVAGEDGRLWQYSNTVTAEVTPTGFTPVTDTRAWTGCTMGDVTYLNRPSGPPVYFGPSSTAFAPLPNMDSAWTCRSLRAFQSYLIALNVTKPATYTQDGVTLTGGPVASMVKWSDLTLAGQVPGSWDFMDATTNSGENVLEDLDTGIVDGLAMRSVFVIYSQNQIWAMEPVDSQSVFYFRRLFSEGGLIAPNCAVEVDGRHYVFGPSDIYVHDGVQKQSIIDKRNRDYVFRTLNSRNTDCCFAAYMPKYNEIIFGYNTGDPSAVFQGTPRCNRAAIYNIPGDTWAFVDLPNVGGCTEANVNSVLTYETATANAALTYETVGGAYFDQDAGFDPHIVMCSGVVGTQVTAPRLLAYDFMNKGSLSFPFSVECNAPAYLERTGLDLDQVGGDLTTYKNVRRIYPQVVMFDSAPVLIQVGGSNTPSGVVTWGPQISFNPVTQYKIDMMTGGRYLAVRFTVDQAADWEIAGFDADVVTAGRR